MKAEEVRMEKQLKAEEAKKLKADIKQAKADQVLNEKQIRAEQKEIERQIKENNKLKKRVVIVDTLPEGSPQNNELNSMVRPTEKATRKPDPKKSPVRLLYTPEQDPHIGRTQHTMDDVLKRGRLFLSGEKAQNLDLATKEIALNELHGILTREKMTMEHQIAAHHNFI